MKDYNELLESLEDITNQMQMDKVTIKQVLETLKSLTKYYENKTR
jgi:hypothetical protein|tara:strand:- start:395 stop:529 length:135 start_codon:yes stop_codon:yes gene_type:complete